MKSIRLSFFLLVWAMMSGCGVIYLNSLQGAKNSVDNISPISPIGAIGVGIGEAIGEAISQALGCGLASSLSFGDSHLSITLEDGQFLNKIVPVASKLTPEDAPYLYDRLNDDDSELLSQQVKKAFDKAVEEDRADLKDLNFYRSLVARGLVRASKDPVESSEDKKPKEYQCFVFSQIPYKIEENTRKYGTANKVFIKTQKDQDCPNEDIYSIPFCEKE